MVSKMKNRVDIFKVSGVGTFPNSGINNELELYHEAADFLTRKYGQNILTALSENKAFMYTNKYDKDNSAPVVFIHPTGGGRPVAFVGNIIDTRDYIHELNRSGAKYDGYNIFA